MLIPSDRLRGVTSTQHSGLTLAIKHHKRAESAETHAETPQTYLHGYNLYFMCTALVASQLSAMLSQRQR